MYKSLSTYPYESIRWHLFKFMRKKNYNYAKDELCKEIEIFLIKYYNLETRVSENSSISLLDQGLKFEYLRTGVYKEEACKVYKLLEYELNLFTDINLNRKKYRDDFDQYTDNDRKQFFLNSLDIVKSEIEKIKDILPDLFNEISEHLIRCEVQINSSDVHQNKQSQFLNYMQVLKDSKTNYIIQRYDGMQFYPIITDMYLDYIAITDNLRKFETDLKKNTKNYKWFRKGR